MESATDYGKVVKTVRELLSTYDVTDKHLCINERGNKLSEIHKEVMNKLRKDYPELVTDIEYFGIFPSFKEDAVFPIDRGYLKVFYVTGGSEGYYVHVETKTKHESQYDRNELYFLAKTLREGEAGISWAERMVCALSRIFKV
jgi:hypothetical protein